MSIHGAKQQAKALMAQASSLNALEFGLMGDEVSAQEITEAQLDASIQAATASRGVAVSSQTVEDMRIEAAHHESLKVDQIKIARLMSIQDRTNQARNMGAQIKAQAKSQIVGQVFSGLQLAMAAGSYYRSATTANALPKAPPKPFTPFNFRNASSYGIAPGTGVSIRPQTRLGPGRGVLR